MGLPAAMKAHQKGDIKLAVAHYERALQQNDLRPVLFQNFGAILRELGMVDKAEKLYVKGLKLFPKDNGIRLNYANLIRNQNPTKAFFIYLSLLQEKFHKDSKKSISSQDFFPLVQILESMGYLSWSYEICRWALCSVEAHPSLLLLLFKLATSSLEKYFTPDEKNHLVSCLESSIESFSNLDKADYYFSLACLYTNRFQSDAALSAMRKGRTFLANAENLSPEDIEKAQKINNVNSWNIGCMLLSNQEFKEGWSLFEYGLRTEAKGGQKWQRAMPKPFSIDVCPLWRGETLFGKHILLLEEQAIGDVMQFITLVPSLLEEAAKVSLLVGNRLLPVYNRSFRAQIRSNRISLISFDDIINSRVDPSSFDFQSPLGSICQYRFTDITKFGTNLPLIKADMKLTKSLRSHYFSLGNNFKRIIGISWRGGGRMDRILQKSVDVDDFGNLLSPYNDIIFVSLQYGDSKTTVEKWRKSGISAYHDDRINPLKNIDNWHSQVAACDAVLSVANTTIHGAGGLNKSTLCLLSQDSDWRWIKNDSIERSYWYPSVSIARQSKDRSWNQAFQSVRTWIDNSCPMLKGSYSL